MGINQFASRRTYGAISVANAAGAVLVANGEPVQVCGMIIDTTTTDTLWTVYDGSDNVLFTFQIATAKTTEEFTIPWMADGGLKVGNDKGTGRATIFHNSPGN